MSRHHPADVLHIDYSALPEAEHDGAKSIDHNLHRLQMLAGEFRDGVGLYLYAHQRKLAAENGSDEMWQMISWMRIAARTGAINAYSFSILLEAINSTNAPTVWAKADMPERERATKIFAREFPSIAGIRTSAAHHGELSKSSKETDKHRLKETLATESMQLSSGTFLEGHLSARDDGATFSSSFRGKLVGYELSMRTADILDEVARHYFRTFYPLEDDFSARMRRRLQETDRQQ